MATASEKAANPRYKNGADGLFRRFLTEVDPDEVLDPEERERRAKEARSEHQRAIAKAGWDRRRAIRAAAEAAGIDVSGVKL